MRIRSFLLLLSLLLPVVLQAETDRTLFSQRVGDTIDRAERDYFVLFPTFPAFQSASTVGVRDSTLLVHITSRTDGIQHDTTIAIPNSTAAELARYIDNFEAVYRFEVPINFALLRSVAQPNRSPSESGSNLEVVLRDGRSLSGELLFVGDSALVIGTTDSSYNWRRLEQTAWRIRYSSIETIRKHRFILEGWAIGAGAGTYVIVNKTVNKVDAGNALIVAATSLTTAALGGLLGFDYVISGDLTAYRSAAPALDEKARFSLSTPPELRTFANNPTSISREIRYDPTKTAPPPELVRYHIWGGLGDGEMIAPYTFSEIWISGSREVNSDGARMRGSVGAEYGISSLLRIGASYSFPQSLEPQQDQEITTSRSVVLYGNFVIIPHGTGLFGPFELCMAPGIGLNMGTAENRPRNPYDPSDNEILSSNDNNFGAYLRTALDFYVIENVSLYSAVEIHLMPDYEFDGRIKYGDHGPLVKDKPHQVNASGVSISAGVQLHL